MTLLEVKSAKITSKGQISIPKSIRKKEGFKEGTKVVIIAFDDRVEIRTMKQAEEKMFSAIMSEKKLAEDWESEEEEEAWKDL